MPEKKEFTESMLVSCYEMARDGEPISFDGTCGRELAVLTLKELAIRWPAAYVDEVKDYRKDLLDGSDDISATPGDRIASVLAAAQLGSALVKNDIPGERNIALVEHALAVQGAFEENCWPLLAADCAYDLADTDEKLGVRFYESGLRCLNDVGELVDFVDVVYDPMANVAKQFSIEEHMYLLALMADAKQIQGYELVITEPDQPLARYELVRQLGQTIQALPEEKVPTSIRLRHLRLANQLVKSAYSAQEDTRLCGIEAALDLAEMYPEVKGFKREIKKLRRHYGQMMAAKSFSGKLNISSQELATMDRLFTGTMLDTNRLIAVAVEVAGISRANEV